MRGLTPEATRLLAEHYPLYRKWVDRRERSLPHLAGEVEHAAWIAFRAACRKWQADRCPDFATYLLKCLWWRRPYRLRPGRAAPIPGPLDDRGPDAPLAPPAPDPGDLIDLADALDRLPAADRELVEAYYRDGLFYREIAARLGSSTSEVQRRHARILATLRRRMDAS